MELWATVMASLVIFTASFFATVSGFGFALVATPLLSLFLDTKVAIILVLAVTLVLRIVTMYRVWGQFDWSSVLLTTAGTSIGVWPGSYALKYFQLAHLEIFLGVVLLIATYLMSKQFHVPIKNKVAGRMGAGVLSGFFGSCTSISGPPLVLYFLNEKTDKDVMRANMVWIFGLGGFITLFGYYQTGNLAVVEDWNLFLSLIPATLLGIYFGEKLFYRLNQHLFRRLSLLIVCFGAIMMLIKGIREF